MKNVACALWSPACHSFLLDLSASRRCSFKSRCAYMCTIPHTYFLRCAPSALEPFARQLANAGIFSGPIQEMLYSNTPKPLNGFII